MTNIFNYQPFIQKEFANIRLLNQIFNSDLKNFQKRFTAVPGAYLFS